MRDIFDKTRTFTRAREAMELGLYPFFQPLEDSDATTAIFKGKEVVMIGSNNYLGLTTDPQSQSRRRSRRWKITGQAAPAAAS